MGVTAGKAPWKGARGCCAIAAVLGLLSPGIWHRLCAVAEAPVGLERLHCVEPGCCLTVKSKNLLAPALSVSKASPPELGGKAWPAEPYSCRDRVSRGIR